MLARRASLLALFIGVLFLRNLLAPAQVTPDFWKNWLDEVAPIMTKTERAVFKNLQTEEERTKFQSFFWKVRDATPGTPENEFRTEFYSRRRYAENRLGGAQSDRGRIYVILGKPAEAQDFSGLDKVVDCELWIYRGEGRSGLPPLMYLLFYRQDAAGEYKLYYPGMNSALDLLSPGMKGRRVSISGAYRMIQASYPELAKATLSVIPDEANSAFPTTLNSSGQTIGMIFTLPEREVEKSYPVLILLGNSSLALKKLDKAAFYFEEVRKFGDTAEANNALGAIYFSLGDKDKAKVYWERAKKLEQKSADKSPKPVEKGMTHENTRKNPVLDAHDHLDPLIFCSSRRPFSSSAAYSAGLPSRL